MSVLPCRIAGTDKLTDDLANVMTGWVGYEVVRAITGGRK